MNSTMQLVSASDARSFTEAVLIGNGVARQNALIIAKCLVEADLRGVDTHGMLVFSSAVKT
jgi:LDH2 family malate/lactate/ureidoglycolate dehydrogenase